MVMKLSLDNKYQKNNLKNGAILIALFFINFFKNIYFFLKFCYNGKRKKEKGRYYKMKSLKTLVAVTHTHTRVFASEIVARNSKDFSVPKNRRNLDYDRTPLAIIV